MKRLLGACLLVASACHLEPVPGPGPGAGPTQVPEVPIEQPAPVAVPSPPPAPRDQDALPCEDGQRYVPGQWEWMGEWTWCAGYCALQRGGSIYVPPTYASGAYVRGHFELDGATAQPAGLRPAYRRYVHEAGMSFAERPPPGPEAAEPQQAPQSSGTQLWGSPWPGYLQKQRPRQRQDPGAAERPPAPARGQGERPPAPRRGQGERP